VRHVAIHYHLFKNAGSSIDKILENGFGANWISFDPKPDRLLSAQDLIAVIDAHPAASAFSSHLIVPPAPSRAAAAADPRRTDTASTSDAAVAKADAGTDKGGNADDDIVAASDAASDVASDVASDAASDAALDEAAEVVTGGETAAPADAPKHTVLTPFRVHPIVVLRDPILRVRSAYLFEWQKQKGTEQPIGTLAEYVREKLEKPRANAIEDFQTLRLSVTDPARTRPPRTRSDVEMLADASAFVASLPAFGLVERFDESLELLEDAFSPFFPDLRFPPVRANTTQSTDTPTHERHARIRKELGEELHAELVARNQMDIALYRYALGRFEALHAHFRAQRRSGDDRRVAA